METISSFKNPVLQPQAHKEDQASNQCIKVSGILDECSVKLDALSTWNEQDFDQVVKCLSNTCWLLFENQKMFKHPLEDLSFSIDNVVESLEVLKAKMPAEDFDSLTLILKSLESLARETLSVPLEPEYDLPKFSDYPDANPIAKALAARILLFLRENQLENDPSSTPYVDLEMAHGIMFYFPEIFEAGLEGSHNKKYLKLAMCATLKFQEAIKPCIDTSKDLPSFNLANTIDQSSQVLAKKNGLVLATPELVNLYHQRVTMVIGNLALNFTAFMEGADNKDLEKTSAAFLALFLPWDTPLTEEYFGIHAFRKNKSMNLDKLFAVFLVLFSSIDGEDKKLCFESKLGLFPLINAQLLHQIEIRCRESLQPLASIAKRSIGEHMNLSPQSWIRLNKSMPAREPILSESKILHTKLIATVHWNLAGKSLEVKRQLLLQEVGDQIPIFLNQLMTAYPDLHILPNTDICSDFYSMQSYIDSYRVHMLNVSSEDVKADVDMLNALAITFIDRSLTYLFSAACNRQSGHLLTQTFELIAFLEEDEVLERTSVLDTKIVDYLDRMSCLASNEEVSNQLTGITQSYRIHFATVSKNKKLSIPHLIQLCTMQCKYLAEVPSKYEELSRYALALMQCKKLPDDTEPKTLKEILEEIPTFSGQMATIEKLTGEVSGLTSLTQMMRPRIADGIRAQTRCDTLTKENQTLLERKNAEEAARKKSNIELNKIRTERKKLQLELKSQSKSATKDGTATKQLQTQITQLEKRIATLTTENTSLTTLKTEKEAHTRKLTRQIEKLEQTIKTLTTTNTSLTKKIELQEQEHSQEMSRVKETHEARLKQVQGSLRDEINTLHMRNKKQLTDKKSRMQSQHDKRMVRVSQIYTQKEEELLGRIAEVERNLEQIKHRATEQTENLTKRIHVLEVDHPEVGLLGRDLHALLS